MHGGSTRGGSFVCTWTRTDIYSGFSIHVAMRNYCFEAVRRAILFCMIMTPFKVLAVNTDNGSEFMNCSVIPRNGLAWAGDVVVVFLCSLLAAARVRCCGAGCR